MRPIRCVSGESSETGSPVTLMNDLSRQCPTHAQFFFTQERRTAFVGGKGGSQGLSFYVSHLVCGCVCVVGWMDARAAEVVLFYQSVVRHEWDGRGITRVSGFGLEHE